MEASTAQEIVDEIRRVLEDSAFLDECSRRLARPRQEIEARVQTSLGEASVGLRLLTGIELAGKRVLEVGAGIGIVSLALHRCGVEVVAIEPGLGGFDQNALIGNCLREWLKIADVVFLSLGAAELRPEKHGMFDVQFSVNVLEHIPDLERAAGSVSAKPRLIFKRQENALVQQERLPRSARVAQWILRFDTKIAPLLRSGNLRAAITELADDIAASSIAQRELIDRLEDRIAALEAERAAEK